MDLPNIATGHGDMYTNLSTGFGPHGAWEHLPFVIPQVVEAQGSDLMKAHWRRDDRGMLLDVLMGPGFEPKHIKTLISMREKREERLIKELKALFSEREKDQ